MYTSPVINEKVECMPHISHEEKPVLKDRVILILIYFVRVELATFCPLEISSAVCAQRNSV